VQAISELMQEPFRWHFCVHDIRALEGACEYDEILGSRIGAQFLVLKGLDIDLLHSIIHQFANFILKGLTTATH
jgi:hypothetical protein